MNSSHINNAENSKFYMQAILHEGYLCDSYKRLALIIMCKSTFNLDQIFYAAGALISDLHLAQP